MTALVEIGVEDDSAAPLPEELLSSSIAAAPSVPMRMRTPSSEQWRFAALGIRKEAEAGGEGGGGELSDIIFSIRKAERKKRNGSE